MSPCITTIGSICTIQLTVDCAPDAVHSDLQTGKITAENRIHDADIKDMQFSKDGTHFITASGDRTSKLVDSQDLQVMKEFAFERPANAAAMSPIADHVGHSAPSILLRVWLPRQKILVVVFFACHVQCGL